jgi:pimeloyl-ACP methyl ester carboxylesterase
VDLRGFGLSNKPSNGGYALTDQAAATLQVIRELDLSGLTIIGHSMGGAVALLLALDLEQEARNRLHRLVLIDSIACRQRLPLFIALLRLPVIGRLAVRLVPASWAVRHVLGLAYYDQSKIEQAFVEAYAAPLRSRDARIALAATARALVPPNLDELTAQYRTIRVPILLLWGRQDRIVPLSVVTCLPELLPAPRLEVLDGCGHIPHEEWPQLTMPKLREFFAESPARMTISPGWEEHPGQPG